MSARDRQVNGSHYAKGKTQPFDLAMDNEYNYFQSHALTYLHRYGRKGTPIDDLRKLIHLAEMEIERLNVTTVTDADNGILRDLGGYHQTQLATVFLQLLEERERREEIVQAVVSQCQKLSDMVRALCNTVGR